MDTPLTAPERLRRIAPGPTGPGPVAAFAALFEPVLAEAAAQGRIVSALSTTLDIAHPLASGEVTVEAWVERATRTLVFASAEARAADGRLAAAASSVFRVQAEPD